MKNLTFSKVSMSLIALALLASFSLVGCGSGGGGGDGSSTADTTGSATVPTLLGGAMQGNLLSLAGIVSTYAGIAPGSADGTGAAARFNEPLGLTTDGTYLYVADTYNNTIRQIVISSGAVTTLAGTAGAAGPTDGTGTAARFNGPHSLTTDGTNLYVSDTINSTIRKIQ